MIVGTVKTALNNLQIAGHKGETLPMHPGGITPEQLKAERQKLADRQVVAATVAALLSSAKVDLQSAESAGPLDAVKYIARAFASYMESQRVQVEMNMKLDAITLSQLDAIIKQLASPIIQAAPTGSGPIPNQGRR